MTHKLLILCLVYLSLLHSATMTLATGLEATTSDHLSTTSGAIFTVNDAGDAEDDDIGDGACRTSGGVCTLRAAIQEANADRDHDIIRFELTTSLTIAPSSMLPSIVESVTIDGVTGNPATCPTTNAPADLRVTLSGQNVVGDGLYLREDADGSVILGLNIVAFDSYIAATGIKLAGGFTENYLEDVTIRCNQIGTDNFGNLLGNQSGIEASGVANLLIGGVNAADRNVIASNTVAGVGIYRQHSIQDRDTLGFSAEISGNYIGTTPAGTDNAIGNGDGIHIYDAGSGGTVHSLDVRIGRLTAPNLIAYNNQHGIDIADDVAGNPLRAEIRGNSIHDNDLMGINLANDGVEPQYNSFNNNAPQILEISLANLVTARLKSADFTPLPKPYNIDVYASESCDQFVFGSGHGEGQTYLGTVQITPTQPDFDFTYQLPALPANTVAITMLSTNIYGDTSEFSNCGFVSEVSFTVNSRLGDSDETPGDYHCHLAVGGCTFTAVIEEINALAGYGPFRVNFAVNDWLSGDQHFEFVATLPTITNPVIIDGLTQTGAECPAISGADDSLMEINQLSLGAGSDGSVVRGLRVHSGSGDAIKVQSDDNSLSCLYLYGALSDDDGIDIIGDSNTIGGTALADRVYITNFGDNGIELSALATGNMIGNSAISNNGTGISVLSLATNNQIGAQMLDLGNGLEEIGRNTIRFSDGNGIVLAGTGGGNYVGGNNIGVADDGVTVQGNGGHGIRVESDDNVIGRTRGFLGLLYNVPNVIGSNGAAGISVDGDETHIVGNSIGVPLATTVDIGNTFNGIIVSGENTLIENNFIGNNGTNGIYLNAPLNDVYGNTIGLFSDGTTAAGNGHSGIFVNESSNAIGLLDDPTKANTIAHNTRYGVSLGALAQYVSVHGNVIHDNVKDGIAVTNAAATDNNFRQNALYSNGEFGIDLGADDAVLDNDAFDADSGANGLMNRAELLSADGDNDTINFYFHGAPNTIHHIEFYASPACDDRGGGEGQRVLKGLFSFTTDSGGDFTDVITADSFNGGEIITALVSDSIAGSVPNNTSEFSDCATATGGVPTVVSVQNVGVSAEMHPIRLLILLMLLLALLIGQMFKPA